jgi:hypothetical protein
MIFRPQRGTVAGALAGDGIKRKDAKMQIAGFVALLLCCYNVVPVVLVY